MSFPYVLSGNTRHGYPIKAFGNDNDGDDREILSPHVTRLKHSSASLSRGAFGHDKYVANLE